MTVLGPGGRISAWLMEADPPPSEEEEEEEEKSLQPPSPNGRPIAWTANDKLDLSVQVKISWNVWREADKLPASQRFAFLT